MKVVVVALSKAYRAQHGGSVWRKGVQHGVTGFSMVILRLSTAERASAQRTGLSTAYSVGVQHGVK